MTFHRYSTASGFDYTCLQIAANSDMRHPLLKSLIDRVGTLKQDGVAILWKPAIREWQVCAETKTLHENNKAALCGVICIGLWEADLVSHRILTLGSSYR